MDFISEAIDYSQEFDESNGIPFPTKLLSFIPAK